MAKAMTIADITHPKYDLRYREWQKWRLTYHGGPQFIEQYLKQYTKREDYSEFLIRKSMTYCPSFASAAVDEVKNSIYQRMADISRDGGSQSYQNACAGLDHGVDLLGNTMTSFIGQHILPELLTMGRVGIYVDMPPLPGETILALGDKRPYIYLYETEDIRSWTYDASNAPNEFGSLLLRDYIYVYDEETGLPKEQVSRFRHYWLEEGEDGQTTVMVQFYSNTGDKTDQFGNEEGQAISLNIPRIPFVILEITDSLLRDIANYQIALLNLESSDLSYVLKSNFPFYVEQFDPKTESPYLRKPGMDNPGQAGTAEAAKQEEIVVGPQQGRRYPMGANPPAFIYPSSEPLKASMQKQESMRESIRLLLGLAISNLQPRASSAEAKGFDERSLEAGLSAIGLELESAERLIADYWSMYEKKDSASVKYPEKYNLKSDEERLKEADSTTKLIPMISSVTFGKEMSKRVARIMLGNRVSEIKMRKIEGEIDKSPAAAADPDVIKADVEAGLVDLEAASQIRGYPPGSVQKAAKDHAERIARIAQAQAPGQGAGAAARGNPDGDANSGKSAADEKAASRDSTTKDTPTDGTRGKGAATS